MVASLVWPADRDEYHVNARLAAGAGAGGIPADRIEGRRGSIGVVAR